VPDALHIGGVVVTPPLVLAPMAGVTTRPFRVLCRALGAGLVCGEMISATALRYANKRTRQMLELSEEERPVSMQIAACGPDLAEEAVRGAITAGAAIVDLNFGCPVPKVRRAGAGAVLMRDLGRARAIVEAAVASAAGPPVTVKMRAGWDDDSVNFPELAALSVEAGAKALVLHARTAEQYYSGEANWAWIAELVRLAPVPVIGNGDVRSGDDALRMLEETGCAGVMIGRAARTSPWVFREAAAALAGQDLPAPPDARERLGLAVRLCDALIEELGETVGCLRARGMLGFLGRGIPSAARFRERAHQVSSREEIHALVAEYLAAFEAAATEEGSA